MFDSLLITLKLDWFAVYSVHFRSYTHVSHATHITVCYYENNLLQITEYIEFLIIS